MGKLEEASKKLKSFARRRCHGNHGIQVGYGGKETQDRALDGESGRDRQESGLLERKNILMAVLKRREDSCNSFAPLKKSKS
jgi:hypothetical protein